STIASRISSVAAALAFRTSGARSWRILATAPDHTVCNRAFPAAYGVTASGLRRLAANAPSAARTAVTTQKTSQPAWSASAPSGGVQRAEMRKTTVAAVATDRPA